MRTFNLKTVLSTAVLTALVLLLVNALLPQALIYATGNYFFASTLVIKAVLVLMLLFTVGNNGNLHCSKSLFVATTVFCIYLLFDIPYQTANVDLNYILTGYNSIFFYCFVLVLVVIVGKIIPMERVIRCILLISAAAAIIGCMQYLFNKPILNINSPNKEFNVLSYIFYGNIRPQIRGFSLFSNAFDAGFFYLFSIGIVFNTSFKKLSKYFMIALLIAATYSTVTRNIYIGMVIVIFASVLYRYAKPKLFLFILPLLSFAFALFIPSFGKILGNGLADNESLVIRQDVWGQIISNQYRLNIQNTLLGQGLYQSENSRYQKILVDNTYFHLIIHIGVLGLVLFLSIYFVLLLLAIRGSRSPIMGGFYGLLAAWPALAMYNILIVQIILYSVFVLLIYPSKYSDQKKELSETERGKIRV